MEDTFLHLIKTASASAHEPPRRTLAFRLPQTRSDKSHGLNNDAYIDGFSLKDKNNRAKFLDHLLSFAG